MTLPFVTITTDGSCHPNNGFGDGGWAAVLRYSETDVRRMSGAERRTSNNRMEFTAILEALRALEVPSKVTIRTDSQYAMKACTTWVKAWVRRGWRTGKGDEVKNQDLIRAILDQMKRHKVTFTWVRGHNGDWDNEECDRLAATARRAL